MCASQYLQNRQGNVFYLQLNSLTRSLGQITHLSGRINQQLINSQPSTTECARRIEFPIHWQLNNYQPSVDPSYPELHPVLIRPCHLLWSGLIVRLAGQRIRERPIYGSLISKCPPDTSARTNISNYSSRQVKSIIRVIHVSYYPISPHDHGTFLEYQET